VPTQKADFREIAHHKEMVRLPENKTVPTPKETTHTPVHARAHASTPHARTHDGRLTLPNNNQ